MIDFDNPANDRIHAKKLYETACALVDSIGKPEFTKAAVQFQVAWNTAALLNRISTPKNPTIISAALLNEGKAGRYIWVIGNYSMRYRLNTVFAKAQRLATDDVRLYLQNPVGSKIRPTSKADAFILT